MNSVRQRASSASSKLKSKRPGMKSGGGGGDSEGSGAPGGGSKRGYSSLSETPAEESDEPSEQSESEEEPAPRKKGGGGAKSNGLKDPDDNYSGWKGGAKPKISMAYDSTDPEMLDYSKIVSKSPKTKLSKDALPPEDDIKGEKIKKRSSKANGVAAAGKKSGSESDRRSQGGRQNGRARSRSRGRQDSESDSASEDDVPSSKQRNGRKAAAAAGAAAAGAAGGAAVARSRKKDAGSDNDSDQAATPRRRPASRASNRSKKSNKSNRASSGAGKKPQKKKSMSGAFDDDDDASDDTARSPESKTEDLPADDPKATENGGKGMLAGIGATMAGAGAAAAGLFGGGGGDAGKKGGSAEAGSETDGYVETDDGEDIMAPMRGGGKGRKQDASSYLKTSSGLQRNSSSATDDTVSGSGSDADRQKWARNKKKGGKGMVMQDKINEDDETETDIKDDKLKGGEAGKKGGTVRKGTGKDQNVGRSGTLTKGKGKKDNPSKLTREDRHYLNKALICIEMQREWSALSQMGELCMYGYPFRDHPILPSKAGGLTDMIPGFVPVLGKKKADNRVENWEKPVDPPILSFLFNRFVYGFPGLRDAKRSYWTDNIQPFFDGFANRNFSWTRERSEVTKRRMLSMGFTRLLSTYFNVGITALGDESPARPSLGTMRDIDGLFPGKMQSMYKASLGINGRPKEGQGFNAWVAVPKQDGNEYVIATQVIANAKKPFYFAVRSWRKMGEFLDELEELNEDNRLGLPVLPTGSAPDRLSVQRILRAIVIALSNPPTKVADTDEVHKARQVLEKFLLEQPIKISESTKSELLSKAERDDQILDSERKRWTKAGKRVRTLRTTWNMWRDALIGSDELDKTFNLLRRHDRLEKLPQIYQDTEHWARLWVAYLINFVFVTGPASDEVLSLLTRFHKLIPYELLKQGLKIVNPTIAIKVVVNTVLAQPMGQPSLFQRIFSLIANGDIRARNKDIKRLRQSLGHEDIADILEKYVYSAREDQEQTREQNYGGEDDIVITILKRGGLSSNVLSQVEDWQEECFDPEASGDGPEKFKQIKELLRAYCLKRDREQVIGIVMEPNTPHLLKASIAVFYDAIWNIANASDLARALGDLQAFITDLLDALHNPQSPNMMGAILRVIDKHEPSLWYFLHEIARHGDLMDPLQDWCRDGLKFLKVGIPTEGKSGRTRRLGLNIDSLLDAEGEDTAQEVIQEIRAVAEWTRHQKAMADLRNRVDVLSKEGVELDYYELAEELAARNRPMQAFKEKYGTAKDDVQEEDVMGWAWWAGEDILDNPGDVQVDWVAKKKAEAKAAKKNKKKGLFGGKAKTRGDLYDLEETDNTGAQRILPTPPRLHATRTFLDAYLDQVQDPLFAAKEEDQSRR